MDTELLVRILSDFRQEMNARFERLEGRSERRFEGVDHGFVGIDQRFDEIDRRFEAVDKRFERLEYQVKQGQLELTAQIAAVTRSLNEELLVGRRELRSRLDRCERELDELRRRDRD